MEKKKYTSIMISFELKKLMEQEIIKTGIKMSYSQLIKYLIDKNGKL